ncbi:MAG: S10 family peptidase, partial [Chitinophagaceae bacterium]
MKHRLHLFCLSVICLSFIALPSVANAQGKPQEPSQTPSKVPNKDALSHIEPAVTTSGSVTVDGQHIDYNAVVGTIPILDQNDQDTTARMGFVAYFKKGVTDLDMRPITFLYNGGPGSSTIWLHMGCFGPKRVVIDSTIHMHGAPYELVNNQYSLMDASDLVFIDMPGTGFGRIEPGQEKNYWGVDEDARAFGQFIMRFITQYNRWNSPKYVFGESYGTTRSAVLCNLLQNAYNIDLNGVILLSQILDFGNSIDGPSGNPGDDRPYELALPTYAATAWYHHKLPEQVTDLPSFLDKVEKFSMGDYAHALSHGSTLVSNSFYAIAELLHSYTGLPVAYIKKANLRISGGEFEHTLLGQEDEVTGRLDTRFSGPAIDPLAQGSHYDPQSSSISGA